MKQILERYEEDPHGFVLRCCNESHLIEEVCGLDQDKMEDVDVIEFDLDE